MTYVISDIHGYFGKFKAMLEAINFTSEDTMYIVGDCIDRGPQGWEVIQYVMEQPNMHMIMGNHEHMFMSWYEKNTYYKNPYNEDAMRDLLFYNGGLPTIMQFEEMAETEQKKIYEFIKSLPFEMYVDVNEKRFRLVHGFPAIARSPEDKDDYYYDMCIWERPISFAQPEITDCDVCIIGHTPTCEYNNDKPYRIHWLNDKLVDIDCGMASNKKKFRRLGCMRLDDMKEFYV